MRINLLIHALAAAALGGLLCFSPASAHEGSCGGGLVLVYERGAAGGDGQVSHTVTYYLTRNLTVVHRPTEKIVIDYGGRRLFRLDPGTKGCSTYKLSVPDSEKSREPVGAPDDAVSREKAGLLGSYTLERVNRPGLTGHAAWKRVDWGAGAELYRTAARPAVEMYGQLFEPAAEEYLTSSAVERIDDLFCLAALRETYYKTNPLLRRLDICGLAGVLKGIPLEVRTSAGETFTLKEVVSAGQLSLDDVLRDCGK